MIGPEKAETVCVDEAGAFGLILPCSLGSIAGALGEDDVVVFYDFFNEAFGIGDGFLIPHYGTGRRKGAYNVRIAAFEVPEVMKVAVGEDDEAAVL